MHNKKMTTAIVFGTFDHLHAGHQNLIQQARAHADHVIALVSRDKTTEVIKSKRPDNSEKQRLQNLKATGWADTVILGEHGDKYTAIKKHKPDVIALGYDQFVFTQQLQKIIIANKLNTEIVRLSPYHPDIYKSSLVKMRQTALST
jgi:FAD synthetase